MTEHEEKPQATDEQIERMQTQLNRQVRQLLVDPRSPFEPSQIVLGFVAAAAHGAVELGASRLVVAQMILEYVKRFSEGGDESRH